MPGQRLTSTLPAGHPPTVGLDDARAQLTEFRADPDCAWADTWEIVLKESLIRMSLEPLEAALIAEERVETG